ncbi:MAG TPA: response regulator transcription factor [Miltoncostaeaceae bacterium]|nr:response regulator transcription factor [Miltoncostaeaceae bacterium]
MTPARVLLADDHAMVRQGLRLVLEGEPDFTVVAEAGDGLGALERGTRDDIDLAVLDVAMPGMTGLRAARELVRRRPALRVVMLSMYDHEEYVLEALRSGASGYVLKSMADRDLVTACRAAMEGDAFLQPGEGAALVRARLERAAADAPPSADPLTPRERDVLKLIAEAHTSKEIAEALVLSVKTVESHRANILAKLGMRDRVELTRYAIRRGLVEA